MAIFLMMDGRQGWVSPADPAKGFTLGEFYQLLECTHVEIAKLPDGRLMVFDADRAKRLPVNLAAMKLFLESGAGALSGRAVVGNVVICEKAELL